MKKVFLLAGWVLAASAMAAAAQAQPDSLDPRILTIPYDPDQVALLRGTLGYQFMLEFDSGEKIETVSIGDAQGWQVTPNRAANVLFLKPMSQSQTNMAVVTDVRRYAFQLQVVPQNAGVPVLYVARMVYPKPAQPPAAAPADAAPQVSNNTYEVTGSKAVRPVRIFDDGRMTYFQWSPEVALPAIFAVSEDGSESLVNYVIRGPYVVVDQLAAAFVLRDGKEIAKVNNHGRTTHPNQGVP